MKNHNLFLSLGFMLQLFLCRNKEDFSCFSESKLYRLKVVTKCKKYSYGHCLIVSTSFVKLFLREEHL